MMELYLFGGEKMKGLEKALQIVKTLGLTYVISFFVTLILGTVFVPLLFLAWLLLAIGPFFMIGIIVYYYTQLKKYGKEVLVNKPKRKFKYLDSFYYKRIFKIGGRTKRIYFVLHIIEDIDTERIYAIGADSTNAHLDITNSGAKILKGVGIRKNWKEVSFNEEGMFWIDQEVYDCYCNEGENVIIKYFIEEHKISVNNELFHCNLEYDNSLLDKATFIMGFAEFNINN